MPLDVFGDMGESRMKYSYGVVICTFDGAERVGLLLESMAKCKTLEKFSKKIVVEDKVPEEKREIGLDWYPWKHTVNESHHKLIPIMAEHPDWEWVSLRHWGNMQGCANEAIKACNTDFVWYISDDVLVAGDPFRHLLSWTENADKSLIDITGLISPKIYNSDELVRRKILKDQIPSLLQVEFYDDPFNTWFKNPPDQLSVRLTQIPHISGIVNGGSFIVKRDAWESVGGIHPDWDVLDQELSYSIYLETDRIIYSIPTDPLFHCGGCAQNGGFTEIRAESLFHRLGTRCVDIFGSTIEDVDKKVHDIAVARTELWQNKLLEDFFRIAESDSNFLWKFL